MSIKILLVEDNMINQKIISHCLDCFGYEYDIADNGEEAFDMFEGIGDYSIVLMDCMMPVMDGFEATQKIRSFEVGESLPKTPIMALTASTVEDDINKCFTCGMDDYLSKPINAEALKEKIEKLVG